MTETNNGNTRDTIDLAEMFALFWEKKVFIILLAVICGAVMAVNTYFFTKDTYTAYLVLHISNKNAVEATEEEKIQKSDIDTSKSLSETYIEILKTRAFFKDVSKDVRRSDEWERISKCTDIEPLGETELLKISVTTQRASESYEIAYAIMKLAPDKLTSVYKAGEVEIVDPPAMPTEPNSKSLVQKTALGFIGGGILSAAYIFMKNFFDRKIHSGDEVEKRYNIAVLGEIAE